MIWGKGCSYIHILPDEAEKIYDQTSDVYSLRAYDRK